MLFIKGLDFQTFHKVAEIFLFHFFFWLELLFLTHKNVSIICFIIPIRWNQEGIKPFPCFLILHFLFFSHCSGWPKHPFNVMFLGISLRMQKVGHHQMEAFTIFFYPFQHVVIWSRKWLDNTQSIKSIHITAVYHGPHNNLSLIWQAYNNTPFQQIFIFPWHIIVKFQLSFHKAH